MHKQIGVLVHNNVDVIVPSIFSHQWSTVVVVFFYFSTDMPTVYYTVR